MRESEMQLAYHFIFKQIMNLNNDDGRGSTTNFIIIVVCFIHKKKNYDWEWVKYKQNNYPIFTTVDNSLYIKQHSIHKTEEKFINFPSVGGI